MRVHYIRQIRKGDLMFEVKGYDEKPDRSENNLTTIITTGLLLLSPVVIGIVDSLIKSL